MNNLKQIGLAIANYESAAGSFPTGAINTSTFEGCSGARNANLFEFIMPHLESGSLYNAVNFTYGNLVYNAVVNTTAMSTKVNVYVCPSDQPNYPLDPNIYIGTAQTSYGMVLGNVECIMYGYNPPTNAAYCNYIDPDGTFGVQFTYRIANVTDGLSNTLFFGETSRFKGEPATYGAVSSFFNTWVTAGGYWMTDDVGGTRIQGMGYTVPKINAPAQRTDPFSWLVNPFTWWTAPQSQTYGQLGFRSMHPGGANFLAGDGSVKFIKESIALNVYRALGTRAGGEVISADSY